jgi:hypothetical protein
MAFSFFEFDLGRVLILGLEAKALMFLFFEMIERNFQNQMS